MVVGAAIDEARLLLSVKKAVELMPSFDAMFAASLRAKSSAIGTELTLEPQQKQKHHFVFLGQAMLQKFPILP